MSAAGEAPRAGREAASPTDPGRYLVLIVLLLGSVVGAGAFGLTLSRPGTWANRSPQSFWLLLLFFWIALAFASELQRRRGRSFGAQSYVLFVWLLLTLTRLVESDRLATIAMFVSVFCAVGAMTAAFFAPRPRDTAS